MIQQWKHSGRLTDTPSSKEIEHGKLARRAAAEGCVLLKNEGILPFGSRIRLPCSAAVRERL